MLVLLEIVLWPIFSLKFNGYDYNQRILDSCNSYTSCSSCTSDSSCIFLNNACVSASTSTVSTDAYSALTESAYCSSYTSSGIISLGSSDETYSLFQLAGASFLAHPTCFWTFSNPNLKTLKITFQRLSSNYEDIYILYNYNSLTYYLSTKELTKCSSSTLTFSLTNISSLSIKMKRLNAISNYDITLSSGNTTKQDSQVNVLIGIIIVSILVFTIFICVSFIVGLLCYYKYLNARYLRLSNDAPNEKLIDETLAKMISCKFVKCEPRYRQLNCIICLENFEPESSITITNECNHIFHTKCLKTWYLNIRNGRKLTCPHCLTENSPDSHPLESCELASVMSDHIQRVSQRIITVGANNNEEGNDLL